jgi:LuxR family maltose regulon positive regulatory protein
LFAAAEANEWWGHVLELSLLRALFYQAQGDSSAALLVLEQALTLAGPEGYHRVFLDEGESMRRLLLDYQSSLKKRIGERSDHELIRLLKYTDDLVNASLQPVALEKSTRQDFIEPLSERELAILRLIATGRSNQEIAELLVVAVSTVKSHINNLYSKLGTNRRTQAIAIARDLGLLTD